MIMTICTILHIQKVCDLKKYQVSKVLRVEEERLSNLDKEFSIDIDWE